MFDEFLYSTAAIDEAADDLLAQGGLVKPPVNAVLLARSLGLEVAWDNRQRGRARLVSQRKSAHSTGTILLRSEPRSERLQWAVAHEIGEHVAAELFQKSGFDGADIRARVREDAANLLAARILLPASWFERDAAACDWDLFRLKAQYSTASHELIARRMLDFDLPIAITIFDEGRLTLRRTNRSKFVPPVHAEEAAAQTETHSCGQPVARHGELTVQAWPIHEPEWKREILRAQFPEE